MIGFFLWFIFLSFSYFFILYLFIDFSNKEDRYNNLIGFASLFFVFIQSLIILILIFQDISLHLNVLPLWIFALGLPIVIIIFFCLLYSSFLYLFKLMFKNRNLNQFYIKFKKKRMKRTKIRNDLYRKIPHIFIFLGLFILWFIGVYIIQLTTGSIEGMIPYENNLLNLYLQLLTMPNIIKNVLYSLGWFYYLIFFCFYTLALIALVNEFTRKSRNFKFPFHFLCIFFMNEKEKRGYGTYLYFALGSMFASFICPPMVFFSILGISSIADLVTSQIGLRYGKHHIKFNQKKTWEGTIVGSSAAFFICFLFTGFVWAVIFTFAFLLFDILTNKPINLSDNLITPIGLSLLYFILRHVFDLNYNSLIIQIIF